MSLFYGHVELLFCNKSNKNNNITISTTQAFKNINKDAYTNGQISLSIDIIISLECDNKTLNKTFLFYRTELKVCTNRIRFHSSLRAGNVTVCATSDNFYYIRKVLRISRSSQKSLRVS